MRAVDQKLTILLEWPNRISGSCVEHINVSPKSKRTVMLTVMLIRPLFVDHVSHQMVLLRLMRAGGIV